MSTVMAAAFAAAGAASTRKPGKRRKGKLAAIAIPAPAVPSYRPGQLPSGHFGTVVAAMPQPAVMPRGRGVNPVHRVAPERLPARQAAGFGKLESDAAAAGLAAAEMAASTALAQLADIIGRIAALGAYGNAATAQPCQCGASGIIPGRSHIKGGVPRAMRGKSGRKLDSACTCGHVAVGTPAPLALRRIAAHLAALAAQYPKPSFPDTDAGLLAEMEMLAAQRAYRAKLADMLKA